MNQGHITRVGESGWAHAEPHLQGIFHTYDRFALGGGLPTRPIHVYLPRAVVDAGVRCPVVYLLDGDVVFWRGGVAHKSWRAAETLDRLAQSGAPLIAVAIRAGDRDAEYTHVDWYHGLRSWGQLPVFAAQVAARLKPFIDAAYPTLPGARTTAIAGSSHGGLAAFWAATAHPTQLGNAIVLSPSFFSGLDSLRDGPGPGRLRDAPLLGMAHPTLTDRALRPRLWLSWGRRRDGGEHNAVVEHLSARRSLEMIDLLTERYGYRHRPYQPGPRPPADDAELVTWVDPIGGHDEDAWAWQLELGLRALLGPG